MIEREKINSLGDVYCYYEGIQALLLYISTSENQGMKVRGTENALFALEDYMERINKEFDSIMRRMDEELETKEKAPKHHQA